MKAQKTDKLYDVVYYNKKGRKLETMDYAKPIALAKHLKRKYENTTHMSGTVKLELNG
jgi:hypothetical protein